MADTVWLNRGGRLFWVDRDGEEHKRLLTEGAFEVEGPDQADTPVEPEPASVEEPVEATEPEPEEETPTLGEQEGETA